MRSHALFLILALAAVILGGCSSADTTGSTTTREYNIEIRNTGGSTLYMVTPLEVTAGTRQTTDQQTDNDPTTRNNANASLAGQGATSSLAGEGAEQVLEGIESVLKRWQDNRKKDSDNPVTTTTTTTHTTNQAPPPRSEPAKPATPGNVITAPVPDDQAPQATASPIDLSQVKWLHTDVSGWPVTSRLASVKVSGNLITLDYDAADRWPGQGDGRINANPWIFVKRDGQWYAATWEWMRQGQRTKSVSAVSGSHIKRDPLRDFRPRPGETYGFMVSGLARDMAHYRNVQERTNIVMYTWR